MTLYLSEESSGFAEWFAKNTTMHFRKEYYSEFIDFVLEEEDEDVEVLKTITQTNWTDFVHRYGADDFLKESIDTYFSDYFEEIHSPKNKYKHGVILNFAKHKGLMHGDTLKWDEGYRNNGLLFWDDTKKQLVMPFTGIDDYGSVPPIFKVGPGGLSPLKWFDTVEHNHIVFPNRQLIQSIQSKFKEAGNVQETNMDGLTLSKEGEITDWNAIFLDVDADYDNRFQLKLKGYTIHQGESRWFELKPTDENRKRKGNMLSELKIIPPKEIVNSFPGGTNYHKAMNSYKNVRTNGGRSTHMTRRNR
jgi:hypothetical protein